MVYELDKWFKAHGFIQCKSEPCLYFYSKDGTMAFVLVCVGDLLCASNSEEFKCSLFNDLGEDYGIKDLGLLHQYLGICVRQKPGEITIDQQHHAEKLLERFGLSKESNSSAIPMETTQRLEACEQKSS